jgi:CDP-diacylglycerol pyrophosphatase
LKSSSPMTIPAGIGRTRDTTGSAAPETPRGCPAGSAWAPAAVRVLAVCVALALAGCARQEPAAGADPGRYPAELAIWRIVDRGCNAHADGAEPAAGLRCESARGYAVLKDRCGPSHYLVIPTARRAGVESQELLQPSEPNYFALAWAERGSSLAMLTAGGSQAPEIGLAINSRYGRSQGQLHIHIDRLRPEVGIALRAFSAAPAATSGARLVLMGHSYRVDRLASLAQSPFVVAAQAWDATTDDARARLTLALVGDGAGGYLLLSDRAELLALDRGHAEELLIEHACR